MIYLNCCCAKLIQALKYWITGIYQTFLTFPPDSGAVTEQAFIANPTKGATLLEPPSHLLQFCLPIFWWWVPRQFKISIFLIALL
jgi:hypothetical protein